MRKFAYKITQQAGVCYFRTNLILRCGPLTAFSPIQPWFSWPLHGFFMVQLQLFLQISKVPPRFFKQWISLGVGLAWLKSHKIRPKKKA